MNFPDDWIAPNEYKYCGCGFILLKMGEVICAKCKYTPKLEDFECGVCSKPATMMFIHGFRCAEHAFQKEPSSAIITDKLCGTYGKYKPKFDQTKIIKEIDECIVSHHYLLDERLSIAQKRRDDGVPPLFWMK